MPSGAKGAAGSATEPSRSVDAGTAETGSPRTRREELGRSARKQRAIMDAARTIFLQRGYLGANMDEIAAVAMVSKQTVYKNFADKQRLFTDIVLGTIDEAQERFQSVAASLRDTEDLADDLGELARRLVTVVIQPQVIQLRRLIIGEADRFPELARAWYERGPERVHVTLAERFAELAERGRLRIADPLLSAQHFSWLVLSIPMNKAMFYGLDGSLTSDDLDRYADEGVRVFLAAHLQR